MVYLVGAGPGDEGLITCKGMELIKNCDAIIYDNLGTFQLMEYVSNSCEKIYVGKRLGQHSKKQEEINEIIIDAAKRHKTVVRLKGGDPFVFGRGGEEIEALEAAGIKYQVVPGVTSAISVPAMCGIPVTHRGISRGFHVITGHTKDEEGFPKDEVLAFAKTKGTGVFLMGLKNLPAIADTLVEGGLGRETPAAVISKGCCPGEKVVRGNLSNISRLVEENKLETPAIIVVGETTEYEFICKNIGPLYGKHIGIVGTTALRNKLKSGLEKKGAKTYSLCNMQVVDGPDKDKFKKKLKDIDEYSYIAFTSQNAINIFFDALKEMDVDIRALARLKFAVVGAGTYEVLKAKGIKADLMPKEYTTRALAMKLASELSKEIVDTKTKEAQEETVKSIVGNKGKILLPRALQGSKELTRILDENNIAYDEYSIYDVVGEVTEAIDYLTGFDIITFVSASGVKAFFDANREYVDVVKNSDIKLACLGEVTRDALRNYGLEADIMPEKYDVQSLIEAIC